MRFVPVSSFPLSRRAFFWGADLSEGRGSRASRESGCFVAYPPGAR